MTLRIHMSSHNDDLHNSTAKRNLVSGVAGIESYGQVDGEYLPIHLLTEVEFRTNPGTGTAAYYPEKLNNNDISSHVNYDNINEYVEVDFDDYAVITEYRHYGHFANDIGELKIQHLWGTTWIDNTVNILTTATAWTGWIKLTNPVVTKKIRVVVTKMNSGGRVYVAEFQIRG